jgi:hypothetical protein
MEGLVLLGAADALSDQYITIRVKRIDRETLKRQLGGTTGSAASAALSFVDMAPKAALDLALPLARNELSKLGVDVETTVSNVPPAKGGRAISEFFPGLVVGTVLGVGTFSLVKIVQRLLGR